MLRCPILKWRWLPAAAEYVAAGSHHNDSDISIGPNKVFVNTLCSVSIVFLLASTITFAADDNVKNKKVLMLSQSPDGHPPMTHEYAAGLRIMEKCLASISGVEVKHVNADSPWPEGPELIRDADCVVMFLSEGARWTHEDPRRIEAFAQLAARGGGFITLHWGMGTKEARYIDGYLKLFGGCHGGPDRKYKVLDADVTIGTKDHPITRGIENFTIHEEFYYQLKLVSAGNQLKPILQTEIDGEIQTVAWAWQRGDGGRSFGFSGGHFHENWSRVEYRRLMTQAVLWSLELPVPEAGVSVDVKPEDLQGPTTGC
ncbi:MAG: ThuA domain-containing protein [Planctomycetota bacterium]|nr:ThuA domain-containing protein [Planctomycetota bacterium]